MSKIAADNLRASTAGVETPTVYPVRGSAKACINLTGTGTIAVAESLNVSGVVDNGAGDYSSSWSSAFAATTYAPATSTDGAAQHSHGSRAVGSMRCFLENSSGTRTDSVFTSAVFGALA